MLAEGSEGKVYGPLSVSDLPVCFQGLDARKRYIVKIFHGRRDIDSLHGLDNKYKMIEDCIRPADRRFFILPVVVGTSLDGKRITGEIQEYGGEELFNWITNQRKKDIPLRLFPSLKKICKICLEIVEKHGILVSDIKTENMVMRENGDVSLIDFDVLKIGGKTRTEFMTTFSPLIAPIQFMDILMKYHTTAGIRRQDLLSKYKRQHMRTKYFFEPPVQETSATTKKSATPPRNPQPPPRMFLNSISPVSRSFGSL